MSHEQFEREKNYRVSLCIAKQMLGNGLIAETDFRQIDTMLKAKYRPIIGSL
jgi:hypothetical protein